jgi:hypothetical protein
MALLEQDFAELTIMMHSLYEVDRHFVSLGASHYHDSFYPSKRRYAYDRYALQWESRLFSRHYFAENGMEIGYCIPDIMPECQPVELDTPRVWGIDHTLHPLKQI